MPIDHKKSSTYLSQREQYQKGGIGKWYWDFRDRQIFSLIDKKADVILDIGCGEGITLEKLIKFYPGKNISGIDIMPENIKICREHNLPAELKSVYNLKDYKNDSVDVCVFSEVIEHLEDIDSAIENIKRILKPQGSLIVVFPNDLNFKIARILFLKFKEAFADPGHLTRFTPQKTKEIFYKKGFKTLAIKNTPFLFWRLGLHSIILFQKS